MTPNQTFMRLEQLLSHCAAFTARVGEELVNDGRSRMIHPDRVDMAHRDHPLAIATCRFFKTVDWGDGSILQGSSASGSHVQKLPQLQLGTWFHPWGRAYILQRYIL